jgi:3-deoxy-7-phosphoheptulonate synthase
MDNTLLKQDAMKYWGSFNIIAGPCSVESKDNLDEIAAVLAENGVKYLRGGVYKMRTSPHSFRGLGDIALSYLKEIGEKYGLTTVSECIDITKIDLMADMVDILLVGTRSMQNYPLLERLGKISNPVILKRGMSATFEEWKMAAEYIMESGNPNIILCERGIRTFEPYTRNTLDLSSIPAMKTLTKLPVIVDPSHSTGKSEFVKSMTWAAVAAGADGVMIETHPCPSQSLCDARQTVTLEELVDILKPLKQIRELLYPARESLV